MMMKILSLFDGISVAQQALKELGIGCEYYASEIDKYTIQITQKNFPDTIHLGDITKMGKENPLPTNIDLIIGGSPCQDLSIAKKNREGLKGSRSGLFYEFVRLIKEVKPRYFVLENVASMSKESKEIITRELFGIEPIMINAALVSAQNRKRLFWVGRLVGDTYENINISQPKDKGILLKDILEDGANESFSLYNKSITIGKSTTLGSNSQCITAKTGQRILTKRIGQIGKGVQSGRIYSTEGKSVSLCANGGGWGAKTGLYCVRQVGVYKATGRRDKKVEGGIKQVIETISENKTGNLSTFQKDNMIMENSIIRKLTPIECERLQSLPDNFTNGVSNTQRYKALGNAFNCEVIKHIIQNLFSENSKIRWRF